MADSIKITGDSGVNTLIGTTSNEIIDGLAGNDNLTGGGGQDKFVFHSGDGIDTITDFGGYGTGVNPNSAVLAELDTLQFFGPDFTAKNLLLTQNGNNLEVTFDNVANTKVILQNFPLEKFANGPSGDSVVDNIQFNGQASVTDNLDVFDNNDNSVSISNQNAVTFLNDLNNNVKGFDNSDDVINGQGGNDTIDGLSGNDYLRGGTGNDALTGGKGNDTLAGGAGQDKFIFGPGDGIDTITDFGGYGTGVNPNSAVLAQLDTLQFFGTDFTAKNLLLTQNGNNLEVTFDNVANTKVILQNFPLEKFANGPSGDSVVDNIQFNGQASVTDNVDVFDNNDNSVSISNQNAVTFLNDLNNNVKGFDNSDDIINGQGGDDTIDGLSGNDYLRGGAGNDILIGGAGNDTLAGGAGNDVLTGGNNADSFVFNTNATFTNSAVGIDQITDFTRSQGDKIVLDKTTFSQITSAAGNGFSNAADFVVGNSTEIQQGITSAAIVYDAFSGKLFYNENGSAVGFGNGGQFATLGGVPNLSASDFVIQA
ncbi:MAG: calcium-binding protein [Nostoc sp.]|uniref:calcium-binding protein n=1 Tax=Nostoc sp. TaxID=1180 RepID=UPI002FFCFDA1